MVAATEQMKKRIGLIIPTISRLKNLQVGYTVPERYMQRIGFNRARIYLSGENLFTLTPERYPTRKPHETTYTHWLKPYNLV